MSELRRPTPKSLFLPGLCCRSEIWESAGARLTGVAVVPLDWPWPERLHDVGEAADWLAEQVRAHRPDFVVGHSFGGILALELRSRFQPGPEWALVVVDAFLVTPHPFFRNHVWQPMPALKERVAAMLSEERPRFPILREVASADDPPGWRERVLSARATYIYGGRSGEFSAAELGELAGVPPDGSQDVHVVPGTSHFPMLERPVEFYATLQRALGIPAPPA